MWMPFSALTCFIGSLGLGEQLTFYSLEESLIQITAHTSREPFSCSLQITSRSWQQMSNAQQRQRSTSHSHPTALWETSQVAQVKGRFSDFPANFLPFVVLSWSLNNTWNLFPLFFISSAWKSWRWRFKNVWCYLWNPSESKLAV